MKKLEEKLIAPCGMNCGICARYLAGKYRVQEAGIKIPYCIGCRMRGKFCSWIEKKCKSVKNGEIEFCFECKKFPCERITSLDERYKRLYRMSMVDNLKFIKDRGIEEFLKSERKKWKCRKCGEILSCHNGLCFKCDLVKLKTKEAKFRW